MINSQHKRYFLGNIYLGEHQKALHHLLSVQLPASAEIPIWHNLPSWWMWGKCYNIHLTHLNQINVESIIQVPERKLGFNRSYCKIKNFRLVQSLNISNLNDHKLWTIATKIPKMKHFSILQLYNCVPKYTRPHHPPTTSNDFNLTTILETIHSQPHQVTPQVIQEILKFCDVDLTKFESYKHCKSTQV